MTTKDVSATKKAEVKLTAPRVLIQRHSLIQLLNPTQHLSPIQLLSLIQRPSQIQLLSPIRLLSLTPRLSLTQHPSLTPRLSPILHLNLTQSG